MLYISILLVLALFWFTRVIIIRSIEKASIELNSEPFDKIILAKKKRIRREYFLQGSKKIYSHQQNNIKSNPAIFIVHGNGETICDWIDTQVMLKDLGYSSYVFDFAGFGSSEGQANVKSLRESTVLAWKHFCKTNADQEKIIVAHSLGVAVLLDAFPKFEKTPTKIILHAAFSSAREMAIHMGTVRSKFSFLIPNVWNSLQNIKAVDPIKTHLFHSKSDLKIPYVMSEKIAFHNANVKFTLLENYGHSAIYECEQSDFWNILLSD